MILHLAYHLWSYPECKRQVTYKCGTEVTAQQLLIRSSRKCSHSDQNSPNIPTSNQIVATKHAPNTVSNEYVSNRTNGKNVSFFVRKISEVHFPHLPSFRPFLLLRHCRKFVIIR
jgi:hypothetical protein